MPDKNWFLQTMMMDTRVRSARYTYISFMIVHELSREREEGGGASYVDEKKREARKEGGRK